MSDEQISEENYGQLGTMKLKNGADEVPQLVAVVMHTLRSLMVSAPLQVYDLAMFCRDPTYEFFGDNGSKLVSLGLLNARPDGKFAVHESIYNVVTSAVDGEGLDMRLVNPVAIDAAAAGERNGASPIPSSLGVENDPDRP